MDELAARLRELFVYCPFAGTFTRLVRTSSRSPVGAVLRAHGYTQVRIDGKAYYLHRLAWLYTTGKWPVEEIDHIDGDPANNRFSNLRDIPPALNRQNQRRARADNVTGLLGVSPRRGGYRAEIAIDGKTTVIGQFGDPQAAHAAYVRAKRQMHSACTL